MSWCSSRGHGMRRRYSSRSGSGDGPFNFIPQGGDDHHMNHRCPGEWITIELMKVSCKFLAAKIDYDVPKQDLQIDATRLPALPESRFVMSNVRPRRES